MSSNAKCGQARTIDRTQQPSRSFIRFQFVAFSIVILGLSLATAAAEPLKTMFSIEAQPARQSLTDYARQAHVQLGFAVDIVDDILTNPVHGEYETAQALEILLKGTGLQAEHGERGIFIRRTLTREISSGMEEPTSATAKTNSLQLIQMAAQAAAQNPTTSAGSNNLEKSTTANEEVPEILVTGSRIRGAQSASPVVTITRQEIERAGFATVEELVETLPQNFGAGASLDTSTDALSNMANVVGGQNVDPRGGGTSVNLRGLGPNATLVLLNGRRLSPSGRFVAFTNISSIPVTAIERVEVLTDGASAIYGSDAIGGVVNFVLRDDYEGAETRLRYGVAAGGDRPTVLFGQSLGKSWDDGNVLFTYEYYDSDNLASSDRDITSSNDLSRFGGTDYRTLGGNPANIVAGGETFAIPLGQDGTTLTAADFDPSAPLNLYNARSLTDVIPELKRHSAFLNLTQEVGPVELFGSVRYSTQETHVRGGVTQIGVLRDITVPGDDPLTPVIEGNPFFVDPTGTGLTTVVVEDYSFGDDLGAPEGSAEIDSSGATLGVRFNISENWNAELAGHWSKEEAVTIDPPRLDLAALDAAVNQTDPNLAFNPFGDGSNTNPAVIESLIDRSIVVDSPVENELLQFDFSVDGDAFDIAGGAVKVATGIEYREESLLSVNTSLGTTLDSRRDVLAAYVEVFFPLVGSPNSGPGLQRFEFSLAGRFEDYSDFGNNTNPKVGVLWSPTQSVVLRGTFGTSFKAPTLVDLDTTANSARFFPQFLVDLGLIPSTLIAENGTIDGLKAEEATTWTIGFDWSPEGIDGLSLNATYFNVDFEDRIDIPTNSIIAASTDPRFVSIFNDNPSQEQILAIVDDPNWIETFLGVTTTVDDILSGATTVGGIVDLRITNLSRVVVTGLEVQLLYDFETELGRFDFGLNGNYLFDFERQFISADPLVDEVDQLGRPVDFRARANVGWSRGGWNVSTFINYVDGYADNVYEDPARSIDSWTTVDLTIGYDMGDDRGFLSDTRLSLTTQNLFDEDPPFVNTFGGLAYDSVNGNPLGRIVALQITKEW